MPCSRCGRYGLLNCHGWVSGNDNSARGSVLRGARFFCSPRRRRAPGCGHSFMLWIAERLPRHSVSSQILWAFLRLFQSGLSIAAAWEDARTGFSLESAYRWVRHLRNDQSRLRASLCRVRAPPPDAGTKNPLCEVLHHWVHALGQDDPISSFHRHLQVDTM
ncbi:MAG: hypothetical protein JJT75_14175 [Opitutales bacterium]|nr:hypothetical protein [Opitutales bacterium]